MNEQLSEREMAMQRELAQSVREKGELSRELERAKKRIEQIEGECRYLKAVVRGEAE